jgi:hypothetical protein
MKKNLLACCLLFAGCCLSAQPVTIILQPGPSAGMDAEVESHVPSSNFGTTPEFASWAWTFNSVPGNSNGLIKFDLSSIPTGATINSATLSLFYAYNTGSAGQAGANDCYLREITSPWTESTVNWNNQPTTTTTNQVLLAASSTTSQSYPNIDVTAMTQDAVNSPSSYYGWELSLITMQTYRSMKFGSSDNPDSTIWPKLVITYTAQSSADTCVTLKPGAAAGMDAEVESHVPSSNFGTTPEFASWAWTFNSVPGNSNGLIKFDLSSIPAGATITSADLSLFYAYNTGSAGQAGANDCYLKEITSPWTESTVNWNNQPTTTTTNQVYLPASTSTNQSYLNIDVTAMMQDAMNSPSTYYGWELSLLTMQTYRSMKFGSSDNPDSTIWPELTICYSSPEAVHEVNKDVSWSVYPNPASTTITIRVNDPGLSFNEIQLFNMEGRLVMTQPVNPGDKNVNLPVGDIANGIYFVKCISATEVFTKRVAVVH